MLFDFSTYALFCLGAFALILTPGPDFFYVATRGLAGGRGAGLVSAFGIGAGLLVHTALAASGLSLLLLASDAVFQAVKWIGAAYLVWIGLKMLRAGDDWLAPGEKVAFSLPQVFRQGLLTNLFNPKVALTFAAFVLPFVQPQRGQAALQITVLGAILCVLATSWFCIVGAFAGTLGAQLSRRPALRRAIRVVSGVGLALLGVRLAFGQRP
ncbi:MAG TPA: LysE family translocator [Abditibacterium sp.]|jgi:threonine/homoserine/homoserine lactone efflux protein